MRKINFKKKIIIDKLYEKTGVEVDSWDAGEGD